VWLEGIKGGPGDSGGPGFPGQKGDRGEPGSPGSRGEIIFHLFFFVLVVCRKHCVGPSSFWSLFFDYKLRCVFAVSILYAVEVRKTCIFCFKNIERLRNVQLSRQH